MKAHERIIFALDVPDWYAAAPLVADLWDHVGLFKVGLELFTAESREIFDILQGRVMLDLKLLDIPETVERAILATAKFNVKFLTIHVGQGAMMERAVKAAEKVGSKILGVTVLTSMTRSDLSDVNAVDYSEFFGAEDAVQAVVGARVEHGISCGLRGFVCSPKEVDMIRKETHGLDITLVVPGVRPFGDELNDQKRVATPEQAVQDGADYVVVGRPIRDAEDPVKAAQSIARSISRVTGEEV